MCLGFSLGIITDPDARVSPLTSPYTTLGNIASWTARHLGSKGPAISHSITCSTALHALLNGVSWLEAGRSKRFIIGGSEAPLTPFTLAQMNALRIYAGNDQPKMAFPCRAGDPEKRENSMVLGEGAACFCLERDPVNPLVMLEGIGYGTERTPTATGLSPKGECLQQSMCQAMEEANQPAIDVLITHTPGTLLGDRAEYAAIRTVFGDAMPALTNNKWKIGHTLGASGALSLELALLMLRKERFIEVPYIRAGKMKHPVKIRHIMINAVGFGGNAISVILGKA